MKGYRSLLLLVLVSAPFSFAMAAASSELDDVTMDVVKHSDPGEITHDIKLPDAVEKDEHEHHAKSDVHEDKDHADDSKEHASESKEQAEDSKESSHESATESHDDVK